MAFVKAYDGPVLTATQTTYTIDPGELIPAGSVLVAAISVNAVDATINAPDGTWTKVQEAQSGGGITLAAFVKAVTADETTTYTFSNSGGLSKGYQGGIARYAARNTTTPVNQSSKFDATATSSTSIDLPALGTNPTVNGCDIIRIGAIANGTTTAAITMPSFERDEWITGSTIAKRPVALGDTKQVTAGAVAGTTAATTAATTTSRVGITIALAPATISSNGPEYVDAIAQATGLTATSWTSSANTTDTSDSTVGTFALGANTTDYGSFFSHLAADWTDLPSNAQIEDVSVTIRMRGQTASRLTAWLRQETANATALGVESTINAGSALSTTLTDYTLTASANFGQVPTRAQLVTGTYGFRLRMQRSNTVTAELASIKTTVTYSTPSTTITENGATSLDGVATVTLVPLVLRRGTLPVTGVGAVSETAIRKAGAATSVAGISQVTPNSRKIAKGSLASTGVSGVSESAGAKRPTSLSSTGASQAIFSIPNVVAALLNISGQGGAGENARVLRKGATAISGVGSVSVVPVRKLRGAISVSGVALNTLAPRVSYKANMSVSGGATWAASGRKLMRGVFASTGQNTLVVVPVKRVQGSTTVGATAGVTFGPRKILRGGFLSSGVAFVGLPARAKYSAAFGSTGSAFNVFSTSSVHFVLAQFSASGLATVAPTPRARWGGQITSAGISSASENAIRSRRAQLPVSGASTTNALPILIRQAYVDVPGQSSYSVVPTRKIQAASYVEGLADLTASPGARRGVETSTGGVGGVTLTPGIILRAAFTATGEVIVYIDSELQIVWDITGGENSVDLLLEGEFEWLFDDGNDVVLDEEDTPGFSDDGNEVILLGN